MVLTITTRQAPKKTNDLGNKTKQKYKTRFLIMQTNKKIEYEINIYFKKIKTILTWRNGWIN